MLEELAQNHSLWLKMAYNICRNKDLSNDLVQDMYLKLHDKKIQINHSYVYFTIKSIFIDEVRRNKEFTQSELIDGIEFDVDDYDYENDKEIQNDIDLINDALHSCKIYKEIVSDSFLEGLRKVSRESGIAVNTIQKHRKDLKQKVWQRKLKD